MQAAAAAALQRDLEVAEWVGELIEAVEDADAERLLAEARARRLTNPGMLSPVSRPAFRVGGRTLWLNLRHCDPQGGRRGRGGAGGC